ncbi:tetratricopeptide repeat protein 8 [Onthophagus taurus]|uniref:tetratricopeptide repeat protein 8 n=1 Tax=Onthophagus taurus TaxID=166361 RepID=UPI000C20E1B9|nr:tetratricopeptide repeat protein 8 [Onthophagus taurus]
MDPLFNALSQFRRRNYDKCVDLCTEMLEKQPLDQAVWCLKMRALTQRIYVDDLDVEDMDSDVFEESVVASAPRPGTSIKNGNLSKNTSTARPKTTTGRPISGMVRPNTQNRPGSALDRLKTARPLTSQSARSIRLGTAVMLSSKSGPFIQISRLNITKHAKDKNLSKPLFEYLYYHEGNVQVAMDLAVQATQFCEFKDWWWKVQLAKCYCSLNLIRDAEQQLRSALKQHYHIETFIRLTRIYIRLDQPLSAQDVCKSGLEIFPNNVSILTEIARLYELQGDMQSSIKFYRNIVSEDAMNAEAIASIGVYHFYNNQPEFSLRYYRRILAMGVYTAELFNNLGLCCLYSQNLDLVLACFQRALDMAIDPLIKADVWYNLSHVAIFAGDLQLAIYCLNLCLSCNPNHGTAFNNLAVLNYKLGKMNLAKTHLISAKNCEEHLEEAETNIKLLKEK